MSKIGVGPTGTGWRATAGASPPNAKDGVRGWVFGGISAVSLLFFGLLAACWGASYFSTLALQVTTPSTQYATYLMQTDGVIAFGQRGDLSAELRWNIDAPPSGFEPMAEEVFADQSSDLSGWSFAGFGRVGPADPIPGTQPYMWWLPHWCLMLVAAVCPSFWFARLRSRRRCGPDQRCRQCGYDLRATPERCPECGTNPAAKTRGHS